MMRLAMSPAAAALLRALIARGGCRAIGFCLPMSNRSTGSR